MSLELGGAEVTLRPLSRADAPSLAAAAAESRQHYAFTSVPDGIEEVGAYLDKAFRQKRAGYRIPFAVVWNGTVVGTTSYFDLQRWEWPNGSHKQRAAFPDAVEIGYTWLAASAQRSRVNTESKYLLLLHAFEIWGVHRVCLRTDVRNKRSWRAIERLGTRFEGVRRSDMPGQDGSVRDSAFFSIVTAEWPAVKRRLDGLLDTADASKECLKSIFPY